MAEKITDSNFEEVVLNSDKVVLVDFWAEWCGPCRALSPIIDELHNEYGETAIIGKVNVDENPELSTKYNIRSIPTILFFKEGEIKETIIGAVSKQGLKSIIDQML